MICGLRIHLFERLINWTFPYLSNVHLLHRPSIPPSTLSTVDLFRSKDTLVVICGLRRFPNVHLFGILNKWTFPYFPNVRLLHRPPIPLST